MQSTAWQELLARVPQKQHDKLVLTTSVGVEIAVQTLVRMQPEYLVIRGRLAGTSDAGRLFFVPYDQINFIGIAKLVQEQEIEEIFGAPPPAAEVAPTPEAAPEQAPEPEPAEEPEPVEAAEPSPRTGVTPTKFPNRAELLQRIRSRSQPPVKQ